VRGRVSKIAAGAAVVLALWWLAGSIPPPHGVGLTPLRHNLNSYVGKTVLICGMFGAWQNFNNISDPVISITSYNSAAFVEVRQNDIVQSIQDNSGLNSLYFMVYGTVSNITYSIWGYTEHSPFLYNTTIRRVTGCPRWSY
jgi:hypothetical protein